MDWSIIIQSICGLVMSGSVIYLIVEKLFARKKDKAEVKSTEIRNGSDVADLYEKIDRIVEKKTAPIQSKLDLVEAQLNEIKSRWCCYRDDCTIRILYDKRRVADHIQDESKKHVCKE